MLVLEDFLLDDLSMAAMVDTVFRSERQMMMFLEDYQYQTREDILHVFRKRNMQLDIVNIVERKACYAEIEAKYGVIIRDTEQAAVEVIYDVCDEINTSRIMLEPIFNSKAIVFIPVTPCNFLELSGTAKTALDPMAVFYRLVIEALRKRATDIHFEVQHVADGILYPVLMRINGNLEVSDLFHLSRELNKSIICKIIEKKTNANSLDLMEHAGVVANATGLLGGRVELRISANRVLDGYHYVMRLQTHDTVSFTIGQLGFHKAVQEILLDTTKKCSGITLVTGAIRTGKNTTAFAMANEMNKQPVKIVSYESPIEVLMPFPQVDYQEDSAILLDAIRLAKKQDVNIAFINEIPTKEVAFAVQDLVNSSIHVITTMHMDRVWHLPYKLKEYYGNGYKDVIGQINVVVNQKMFPKRCPYCQGTVLSSSVHGEDLQKFLADHGVFRIPVSLGCEKCGYTGIAPGTNQPYAEFIKFTNELISRLLGCEMPSDMELVLRECIGDNTLERFMLEGVVKGDLSVDALNVLF